MTIERLAKSANSALPIAAVAVAAATTNTPDAAPNAMPLRLRRSLFPHLSATQTLILFGLFSVIIGFVSSLLLLNSPAALKVLSYHVTTDMSSGDVGRGPGNPQQHNQLFPIDNSNNLPALGGGVASQSTSSRSNNHVGLTPRVMIGIFMLDTPESRLQRMILRVIFPPHLVHLRFVICRPTAATSSESDVVPINMQENMNLGKTHRWFDYAVNNLPSSVKAVFKMDTDAIFCLSNLHNAILDAESKSAYSYYGIFMNHEACSPSGFIHCPPPHCNSVHEFAGDCWFYMSGGFYGFSIPLLREVARTSLFKAYSKGPMEEHHEDVMSGRWVNLTTSRHLVSEQVFDFFHDKQIVVINPPRIDNYFKAYYVALKGNNCLKEAGDVKAELERLYSTTKWKPNMTALFS